MRLYHVECLNEEGDDYATTIFGVSPEGAIARIQTLWEENKIVGHSAISARIYDEDKYEVTC